MFKNLVLLKIARGEKGKGQPFYAIGRKENGGVFPDKITPIPKFIYLILDSITRNNQQL